MAGNRQVWLKSRPNGIPQAENFGIRDGDIPLIAEGEFLVQNHYLSSDPAARGMDFRRHHLLAPHRDWRHDARVCGRRGDREPKPSLCGRRKADEIGRAHV